MSHVAELLPAFADLAQAPPDLTNLFSTILSWLGKILAGGAAVYFFIDMMGHVLRSPRDLRAAGLDTLAFVLLLALSTRADAIVKWGVSLVG